jgi:cyclophilin family peptidyl-prolyl cis-trans isomerase
MGLPPKGRVGYVTRLGAALSDSPFCWPSIYVSQDKSGAGHENLHKVLAFDCLANRGLLDFGHWYLDGYSPGTPNPVAKTPTQPPIVLESNNGLANVRGSLAMARTSEPNSATSQYYINVVDNPALDYKSAEEPGYAVFGKVTAGLDVVDAISVVPTRAVPSLGLTNLPQTNVVVTARQLR